MSWPVDVIEVKIVSSEDGASQLAMFYTPAADDPVPLLVGLHTWSGRYDQIDGAAYADWCKAKGWVFIHPDFRGPNGSAESTGSDLVISDILDAVSYARAHANVDTNRIYLCGVSGGGHAALLVVARAPDIWAGVSVWASITDLAAWYKECVSSGQPYAQDLLTACGGSPESGESVRLEYDRRSPLRQLNNARGVRIDLNAGIHDGHRGSVPISHSLLAFNELAAPDERLSSIDILQMTVEASVPPHLQADIEDTSYGDRTPLFRRESQNVRLTIFDGGHEIVYNAALNWLSQQTRVCEASNPRN